MLIARLATLALLAASMPVATPQAVGGTMVARLCGGGSIAIPMKDGPAPLPEPCPMKACHSGSCRRQFDRSQ